MISLVSLWIFLLHSGAGALVAAATCTVTSAGSASTDDVPAITAAFTKCGDGGEIVLSSGTTYYMNSQLTITGCTKCTFVIDGTLLMSDSTTIWEGLETAIVLDDITDITISGSGTINGNGQAAWDLYATDSSYSRVKSIMRFDDCTGGTVSGFTILNPPNTFFSVNGCTDMSFSDLTLSAVSDDDNEPKNTDGFDIGTSSYITLRTISITNDDDCVAFKPGAANVEIFDITCDGSHGLSVGSLGETPGTDDVVKNIYVSGATMTNCQDGGKAAGIKLYPGGSSYGTATVTNVTWDSVTVSNCEYGAQIQQCYSNTADCTASPSTAVLTEIYFTNWSGSVSTNILTDIDCPGDGTCDVYFENFDLKASSGTAEYLCSNVDDTSSLGITCTGAASG